MKLRIFGKFPGIWIATIFLFAVSPLIAQGSITPDSILLMLPFAAVLAITAIGQTLVVQQRGIDLSVPGMVSLAAVICTRYPNLNEGLLVQGIIMAIAACVLAGFLGGICVTYLSITPIVTTLAVNAFLLGFVQWYSGGSPSGACESINQWALRSFLGLPNTLITALIIMGVVWIVMKKSVIGRRFEAVGANPTAAYAAGIPVRRYVIGSYVMAGGFYAIAGILLAAFFKTPGVFIGNSYLLPTIAAVVLGGTPLTGGVGSVVASVVAALFLTQLGQIVLIIGAPTSIQLLIEAAAILIGMGLRSFPVEGLKQMLGKGLRAAR